MLTRALPGEPPADSQAAVSIQIETGRGWGAGSIKHSTELPRGRGIPCVAGVQTRAIGLAKHAPCLVSELAALLFLFA